MYLQFPFFKLIPKTKSNQLRNMIAFTFFTFIINLFVSSATDVTYLHFPASINPLQGIEHEITYDNAAIASQKMQGMGDKLFDHHNFEDAYKIYQEVLYIQKQYSGTADVAKTLRAIASVKRAMGDFDGALDALADVLDLQMEGSPEDISDILFEIGITMLDGKIYDDAVAVLRDSIHTLRNTNNNSARIAESLDYIGEAYLQMGMIDDAINSWSDSINIWTELGLMARVADTMNSAGVALFRTGDFLNAEIMYEAAIMNYMNQSSDNDESLQNHIALAKKNLSLVENIVNIDFDAEQCIMNYHVPNGKINQTGTIEC